MPTHMMTAREACAKIGLGIDHNRLNEYAAAGLGLFLPPTRAGRARLFEPDDVAALAFFWDLRIAGVDVGHAAVYAARVREALHMGGGMLSIPLTHAKGVAMSVDLDALRARA